MRKIKNYSLSTTCQVDNLASLYQLFLGYKTNGYFVEFGAFDGEYVSNTSGLADIGWKGLYIEPVANYYKKCCERHKNNKNVKVLNCAIGDSIKEIDIHIGGPLSTPLIEMVDKFNTFDWAKGIHTGRSESVCQYPLEIILTEHAVPENFDVLSIDVEGYEWNVLKDFHIDNWKPKIVIIELHDNNINYDNEWNHCNLIYEYFCKHNYRIIYKDFTNTIFIRNDMKQII